MAGILDLRELRGMLETRPSSEWVGGHVDARVRAACRHSFPRGIAPGAFLRRAGEPVHTAV